MIEFPICTQCLGDGEYSRTYLLSQKSLGWKCAFCFARKPEPIYAVRLALKELEAEIIVFEKAAATLWDHLEKLYLGHRKLVVAQEARALWDESHKAEADLELLRDAKLLDRHLASISARIENAEEALRAIEAETVRLQGLNNEDGRDRLRTSVERRPTDMRTINQGYALRELVDRLEKEKQILVAKLFNAASRLQALEAALVRCLEQFVPAWTEPPMAERFFTGPRLRGSEIGSVSFKSQDDDDDSGDVAEPMDFLGGIDENSEMAVDELFSHESDRPNFGEELDRDS
jgi:hypothetical protein